MVNFLLVALLLITPVYIYRRYHGSKTNAAFNGFFLNPLLYLVAFSYLYLVVSSALLQADLAWIFFGISKFSNTYEYSTLAALEFFSVFLLFYAASRDGRVVIQRSSLKLSPQQQKVLNFSLVVTFAYFAYVLIISISSIYPIRGDRVLAYTTYLTSIFVPLKYGLGHNFGLLIVMLTLGLNKDKYAIFMALSIVVLAALIDYGHGGRTITLKFFLVLFLSARINESLKANKLMYASFAFILVSTAIRMVADSDLMQSLYVLFGEFILTRSTVDMLISTKVHGSVSDILQCTIRSGLPGQVADLLNIKSCFLGEYITQSFDLDRGFASSILTESIFYFGDFYIIGAITIAGFFLLLNNVYYRFRMGFLIYLVFAISSMQDMMRTSFYDYILIHLYFMFTYAGPLVLIFMNKKIFIGLRRNPRAPKICASQR